MTMGLGNGFEVQYSEDLEEVCIIPKPLIDSHDLLALIYVFEEKGYEYHIPADERRGFRFVKKTYKGKS